MSVFEIAMQMEKEGEQFYRELAEKTPNRGLALILTRLAADEARHYEVFSQMQERAPDMAETTILADAKGIFAEMVAQAGPFDLDTDAVDLYRQAQELEKKSQEFYLDMVQKVEGAAQKALLERIAAEEKKHYFLLENVIEFVSRPETWLENAEFTHLDAY
jgi:rubrerythrin